MKHVANRRKIVSPLPRKSYSQPKTVSKKSASITDLKSGKSNSVKNTKSVAAKSAPVVSARNAKPKVSASKKEFVGKVLKAKPSIKTVKGKIAPVASKQSVTKKAEKIAPKTVVKAVKANAGKVKPAVVVKKSQPTKISAVKVKSKVAARIEKPKPQKIAAKTAAAKPAKVLPPSKIKTAKNQAVKVETPAVKVEKAKPAKAVKTKKIVETIKKSTVETSARKVSAQKEKPVKINFEKIVQKNKILKPVVTIKAVVRKMPKSKPLTAAVKNNLLAKKAKPIVAKDTTKPKAKVLKSSVASKSVQVTAPKIVTGKTKVVAPVKTAAPEKIKEIEVINVPVPKPKKKKVKPLGAAIFRGKKERYDFQVFPVDAEFEDAAAIFIISRRVVDKNKRAHHRMVCIGQTNSVLSEIKRHRKGKCFKKYEANAISVLREESEQKRLKIESDLKSAHTIPCPHA